MTRRTVAGLLLAALFLLAAGGIFVRFAAQPGPFRAAFLVMGTAAQFHLYCQDQAQAERAFSAGRAEFDRINALCNVRDPESELARLNASAAEKPFVCSPELWLLLVESRRAWRLTEGAFDVTVKPLMDLWGFYRKEKNALPSSAEVEQIRKVVGFEKLRLNDAERSVFFPVPGMALDLGGIAKGRAADLAAEAILRTGVRSGIIDLGGNLRFLPDPPPRRSCYRIAVTDPKDRSKVLGETLELPGNCAVATSGSYERFVMIGGKRYGHIMDPLSCAPSGNRRAVTVTAPDAMTADWLSTAAYLRGEPLTEQLRRRLPGTTFLFYGERP